MSIIKYYHCFRYKFCNGGQVQGTSHLCDLVGNTTVCDHTMGSSLHQFKGNTSSPNIVCLVGRDYLRSTRYATPERVAGEQVRADPLAPLHPWACVSHGIYVTGGLGGGEYKHMAGWGRGLAGGGDQSLPASHRAAVHW